MDMLKATLREYMGSEELERKRFVLDPGADTITIGRSSECTYQVGQALGEWGRGIARIQATITFADQQIVLLDGSSEKPSTNGIWVHGDQVKGSITLTPGLELTLFKSGRAKVCLLVSDGANVEASNHDTYTGEDLLSILQEQVSILHEQGQQMSQQVNLLAGQLAQREAIDANQEKRLLQTEQRLNRMLTVVFASVAVIVVASSFLGGNNDDRKLLTNAGATAVSTGIAIYFETKRKELESAKAKP